MLTGMSKPLTPLGHSGQSIALDQTLDSQTLGKAHKQKRERESTKE